MKKVELLNPGENKYQDTSTTINFRLKDDEGSVLLDDKEIVMNIANDTGYVISLPIVMFNNDQLTVDFNDPILATLPPDKYKVEFEVKMEYGDVSKFPTEGGSPLIIHKDLKSTTGKLVPTITFDEVLNAVDEKVENYLATVVKGDKGDQGDTGPMGEVDTSKDYTFTGSITFKKTVFGPLKPRSIANGDIKTLKELVDKFISEIGGGGNYGSVDYISYNNIFADSPLPDPYLHISIYTRGARTYLELHDTSNNYVVGNYSGGEFKWVKLSDDSQLLHNTGNETAAGDKTFTGQTTFSKAINALAGINGALNTRYAAFTDFADVAKNMVQYIGNWYTSGKAIANSPMTTNYATIQVVNGDGDKNGYIYFSTWPNNKTYIGYVNNGLIVKWSLIADDGNVLHNFGNETADGFKTFSKQIIAQGGIKGDLQGNATTATTANDPNAVHKTGNETITGDKSFTGKVTVTSQLADIALTSQFQNYDDTGTFPAKLVKNAGHVTVYGSLRNMSEIAAGATVTIGTLPVGFRPYVQMSIRQQGSGQNTFLMTIGADGVITFGRYGSGTDVKCGVGSWININTSFDVLQ